MGALENEPVPMLVLRLALLLNDPLPSTVLPLLSLDIVAMVQARTLPVKIISVGSPILPVPEVSDLLLPKGINLSFVLCCR